MVDSIARSEQGLSTKPQTAPKPLGIEKSSLTYVIGDIQNRAIEHAIRNAMTISFAQIINNAMSHRDQSLAEAKESGNEARIIKETSMLDEYSEMDPDLLAAKATQDGCFEASKHCAYVLVTKSKDLFKEIFIVTGHSTATKKLLRYQGSHTLCVVKGVDDKYYAFSPANYKHRKSDFTRIFYGDTLDTLMQNIQNEEGGDWPAEQNLSMMNKGFSSSQGTVVDKPETLVEFNHFRLTYQAQFEQEHLVLYKHKGSLIPPKSIS